MKLRWALMFLFRMAHNPAVSVQNVSTESAWSQLNPPSMVLIPNEVRTTTYIATTQIHPTVLCTLPPLDRRRRFTAPTISA